MREALRLARSARTKTAWEIEAGEAKVTKLRAKTKKAEKLTEKAEAALAKGKEDTEKKLVDITAEIEADHVASGSLSEGVVSGMSALIAFWCCRDAWLKNIPTRHFVHAVRWPAIYGCPCALEANVADPRHAVPI